MSKVYVFTDYGGPETQQLIDRPIPEPGPGELAIEVRAAGVNPADWKMREGRLGRAWSLPAPMGREAAGVVIAVGGGTEGFAVGDEVLGLVAPGQGGLAEHTLLSASTTVAKPEEISFIDAATIPVAAATAYDATHQIELEPGQTLLLLGAGGGVGLMAAQIGRVHEFTVLGVADVAKRELVESTGAAFIGSGSGVADRVREVASSVDLIVDLDEAHRFLGRNLGDDNMLFKAEAFEFVAKEARKYGLNLIVATQRPGDIPSGVLSQIGTLIVHRLTERRDQDHIADASSVLDRRSAHMLPSLVPGEALLVGGAVPLAVPVRVARPQSPPDSGGSTYDSWRAS